jgi:hypothetical protein
VVKPSCEATANLDAYCQKGLLREYGEGGLKMKLDKAQLLALEDVAKGRLRKYRKGYAVSASGPFHSQRTISALERKGYLLLGATGASAGPRLLAERPPHVRL